MISAPITRLCSAFSLTIVAVFGLLATPVMASVPAPRLKPTPINTSQHLSDKDAKWFRSGMSAANDKDWDKVRRIQSHIDDKAAIDVLNWVTAARDPRVSLPQMTYMVQNLGDWPLMTGLSAKGESMVLDTNMSAQKTLAWFQGRQPVSGEGRAALARAYYKIGDPLKGDKWLRLAWRESKLTRSRQQELYREFKDRLTPNDHVARADHLIWQGRSHFDKVEGLLSLMPSEHRALMIARMKVAGNRSGMDAAIARVPTQLQNDPGLLYERARWRRRKQTNEDALPMLLAVPRPPVSETGKDRLWREKKILTYWAIKEKRFNDAYALTLNHGMRDGSGFASAEFLGGWLALTQLNQPGIAMQHFQTLKDGVGFPVSVSRANYWLGRTHDAMGSPEAALYYADAAKFSNTFYGFLAGEKLGSNGIVSLPHETNPTYLQASFEADPRIRAMHILGESQEERYFTQFAFHMDDELESLEHLTLLAGIAKKYGYMKPSLRAAKQASRFQTMLTESGYPMPEAIMSLPNKFDKAFVLAIARQESEFNYKAVSHARAYGLMQMINATAHATARRHNIPYSRARMTEDVNYSATLGALHLHDLLSDYDGSYIMAAVAYNAGPNRVRQWTRDYGDPRKGEIDPVDWLESIPFSETRNYVQRVIENMQVYRARMNGNVATNRVYRDITVGAF